MSINSNTQLWYHEPKPLEGWRPTRTITCEARTTFSQTLIRFKPHHTHLTHQTHVTHHTHKTYVTHITHMRHITQVKSSVACEEKQREDCQTVEFEECREKPKVICKKTLVSDHNLSIKQLNYLVSLSQFSKFVMCLSLGVCH